jgi:outer membrane immunogenic protein
MINASPEAFDGSVAMRQFLLAAVMLGTAAGAQAADMPDFLHGSLPASTPTRNWDGWYAGGQGGESWTNTDYSNTTVALTNNMYRSTQLATPVSQINVLGKANAQGAGFGAFVGRNWQWDDIVLGVEANYSHMTGLGSSVSATSNSVVLANPGLVFPPDAFGSNPSSSTTSATLQGRAALQINDVITFRGRAGWATGDFLPYAFGGLAVGRMDASRSVTSTLDSLVTYTDTNPVTNVSTAHVQEFQSTDSASDGRTNNFVLGWTAGLGFEYMLWSNVFARAEWEYVRFMTVKDIAVTQNSARLGLGYKF